ncbi:hypothetical protein GCM10009799_47450 [Nocardiopsis rhodophaea]|uniref:Uncharacterized protein n=1 Tax=Nocardiopsis rhodophaea TaxID=280238 RepID=A0ABN2TMY9_9ACTN
MTSTATTIDVRTVLMMLSLFAPAPPRPLTARELQERAVRVLADLVASDAPTTAGTWRIEGPGDGYADLYDPSVHPDANPMLDGLVDTLDDVHDFAARFGTEVTVRRGKYPTTMATVDGITVRVWCTSENHHTTAGGDSR